MWWLIVAGLALMVPGDPSELHYWARCWIADRKRT